MHFKEGQIEGVVWNRLITRRDQRGWLCELYRQDEIPQEYHPVMCYISMTEPGVVRGPHEHVDQADYFCFIGPSDFQIFLWDSRPKSSTFGVREVRLAGQTEPMALIVPAGVVHAYKNVGKEGGIVFNAPNRLYRGHGKKETVDEIRHEDKADSIYLMD